MEEYVGGRNLQYFNILSFNMEEYKGVGTAKVVLFYFILILSEE